MECDFDLSKMCFKKKKIYMMIILLILITIASYISFTKFINKTTKIPDDYIVVFYGITDEIIYSTYIYKMENGYENYGFEYISTMKSSESSKENLKIIDKGNIVWTDEIFTVAKKNNAYSYVKSSDGKICSIEDFMGIFVMD